MEKETIFVDGMRFEKPHQNAPEFVKGKISVNADNFTEFLNKHKNEKGYININLKKSKAGNLYLELDTWKPSLDNYPSMKDEGIDPDNIPF